MDKYDKIFLDCASKFDAVTNSYGEITKYAGAVVEENSQEATMAILKKISNTASSSNEIKKIGILLKDALVDCWGCKKISEFYSNNNNSEDDEKSLSELLTDLDELVGLESVKKKVNDLIVFQRVQKLRKEYGLHSTKNTMHLAFTGNPGTGKTTVARIVGRIYKQIGLLSKGHFTEVSRTDLIAGYQGQTALKVKKVIEKAKGGVLFIDEAYSITENEHSDSYGRECLTELTKALEDYRDDLVVIVAGYSEPMKVFFESNPGLKSRFNTFIEFENYNEDELLQILETICKKNDYILSESARIAAKQIIASELSNTQDNFSNGRMVRNLYDDITMNHARRVINSDVQTKENLSTILEEDFN